MQRPNKLQAFKLFADGFGLAAIASATLPQIAEVEAEIRPGGVVGAFDVSMGLQKMTMAVEFESVEPVMAKLLGKNDIGYTFRGSYSSPIDGVEIPHIVSVRARLRQIGGQQRTGGSDFKEPCELTCTAYKETFAGQELFDIDVLNNVWKVGGEDRLLTRKINLGG